MIGKVNPRKPINFRSVKYQIIISEVFCGRLLISFSASFIDKNEMTYYRNVPNFTKRLCQYDESIEAVLTCLLPEAACTNFRFPT